MRALFVVLLLGNLTLVSWILVRSYLDPNDVLPASASTASADVQSPEPSHAVEISTIADEGSQLAPGAASPAAFSQEDTPANGEVGRSDSKTICEKLGPFIEAGPGQGILKQLESGGVSGRISELDVPAPSDYWVYFPPLPSRRDAMNQLAEFQRRDIDSFVITQGALVNGVSLGLFTQEASARDLVTRMSLLGFPANIQEVYRSRREFWINVEYADDGESRQALWAGLEGQFPLMQRRVEPCK